MSSVMSAESEDTPPSQCETNSVNSPGSHAQSLLRLPPELALYLSRTDDTLVRLNKLLSTTAGLEHLLSISNYTCYLLTFFQARSRSRFRLTQLLSRFLLRQHPPPAELLPRVQSLTPSTLANLTALLTNTRTTLRLTALLPLYAWLRSLLSLPRHCSPDPYLRVLALAQCLAYILYQALENIAHLVDLRILPASLTTPPWSLLGNTEVRAGTSTNPPLWLLSSRFWLVGVSCDVLRLLREAYVEAQRRRRLAQNTLTEAECKEQTPSAAEAEAADRRWWGELFVAGCWLPMCLHYSIEGGLFRPSMEDGWVGLLGLAASWEGWRGAWAETKR